MQVSFVTDEYLMTQSVVQVRDKGWLALAACNLRPSQGHQLTTLKAAQHVQ
jgi:hypothetical protein